MSATSSRAAPLGTPRFFKEAAALIDIWSAADPETLQRLMKISPQKASEVASLFATWSQDPTQQMPAIDAFRGDIYSGLQVADWSESDRIYAHDQLTILSGLYGALRACDGIMPYRLEMGYKLPDGRSLYAYWSDKLITHLPSDTTCLLNLSAVEYTKALLPFTQLPTITPKFLTISPKTHLPTFVTVHTKIARGAFANWVIKNRINNISTLSSFDSLGYTYDADLSTPNAPVFVCQKFQGSGLSIRT